MLIGPGTKCAICGKIILGRGQENIAFSSGRAFHPACLARSSQVDLSSLPIPRSMRVGYFREITKRPANPSLSSSVKHVLLDDEDRVIRYLRGGIVLVSSHVSVLDPLDELHPVIGTESILTDGVWDWPDYFPRLIEKYHVSLPKQLLDHVSKNEWVIPEFWSER